MNQSDEAFFLELRKQCVADSSDHLSAARDVLVEFVKDPLMSITDILKSLHSLKGNVQAVGLLNVGEYVHQFESMLLAVKDKIKSEQEKLKKESLDRLEILILKVLQNLEEYFKDISGDLDDSPARFQQRSPILRTLSQWTENPDVVEAATSQVQVAVETSRETELVTESSPDEIKALSAQSQTKTETYLLCRNKNRNFAVPVKKVVEVVQFQKLSPTPSHKERILGLMNLRGEILSVLNLSDTFGAVDKSSRTFVVICNINGVRFGFPIESAEEIEELNSANLQKVDSLSQDHHKGLITHISVQSKRTILIVDLDRVVA